MRLPELQERHFDKLLLAFIFLVLITLAEWGSAIWAQRMADTILGGLIGIITGRAMNRTGDQNGNGKDKKPQ